MLCKRVVFCDPASDADSFKQFLKIILFSLYYCDQRTDQFLNAMHYKNPRFTYLLTYQHLKVRN